MLWSLFAPFRTPGVMFQPDLGCVSVEWRVGIAMRYYFTALRLRVR